MLTQPNPSAAGWNRPLGAQCLTHITQHYSTVPVYIKFHNTLLIVKLTLLWTICPLVTRTPCMFYLCQQKYLELPGHVAEFTAKEGCPHMTHKSVWTV